MYKTQDSLVVSTHMQFYSEKTHEEQDRFSHIFDENSIQFTFYHWSHSIFPLPATQAGNQYSHRLTYGYIHTDFKFLCHWPINLLCLTSRNACLSIQQTLWLTFQNTPSPLQIQLIFRLVCWVSPNRTFPLQVPCWLWRRTRHRLAWSHAFRFAKTNGRFLSSVTLFKLRQ